MQNNTNILEICLRRVEDKFGRDSHEKWVNSDFNDLSTDIFLKTKVSVSGGTLKRIFGKTKTSEGYRPQLATLDALSVYLDYSN